jgi:hypothetical protein
MFLDFMNNALDFYGADHKIWSISGYCPPIPVLKSLNCDIFLSMRSTSWGWATWSNRWSMVDWDISNFSELKVNKSLINSFNAGGNDLFRMLELQYLGKLDSWAIRWCYSQFLYKAYSVVPIASLVSNSGFEDGLGTHTNGKKNKWIVELGKRAIKVECIEPNPKILAAFCEYHNLGYYEKIGYFLRKYGGYLLIKRFINFF